MKKTIWLLIDNRAGSAGQLRGVAQALDSKRYEIIEKKIEYTCLAKLPNFLKGASLLGVNKIKSSDISYQFPDLVLSGSRRTAPVARWIKKQSETLPENRTIGLNPSFTSIQRSLILFFF